MSKFNIGDKVRVYGHGWKCGVELFVDTMNIWDAEVMGIEIHLMVVHPISSVPIARAFVYHQQCRRLVKRERKRVWLSQQSVPTATQVTEAATVFGFRPDNRATIEFIEVRRKK